MWSLPVSSWVEVTRESKAEGKRGSGGLGGAGTGRSIPATGSTSARAEGGADGDSSTGHLISGHSKTEGRPASLAEGRKQWAEKHRGKDANSPG